METLDDAEHRISGLSQNGLVAIQTARVIHQVCLGRRKVSWKPRLRKPTPLWRSKYGRDELPTAPASAGLCRGEGSAYRNALPSAPKRSGGGVLVRGVVNINALNDLG